MTNDGDDGARRDHEEIVRLRDRVHTIAGTVQGFTVTIERLHDKLDALDTDVRAHVNEYEAKVDELILSDELAKAATAALETARILSEKRWTWRERLLVTVVSLLATGCTVATTILLVLQRTHP